jgi:two-component sensor histidine kinase
MTASDKAYSTGGVPAKKKDALQLNGYRQALAGEGSTDRCGKRPPPLIYIDIPALRPGTVGAYAFAFVCIAVATALRLAIDPYVVGVNYVTLFPAVIVTTLISGLGAGLFSLVLSVGAAAFFILPPRFSFYIEALSDELLTLFFILITFVLMIVIAGMRFAIERHKEVDRELERRHKEVDRELEEHRVALREREDRLTTVVGELQHRTRNLLTVVGTIADNTMKKSSTFADFRASYHARLQALARVQSFLFRQQRGDRVTFDELIEAELAAQSANGGDGGRLTLDGPKGVGLPAGTVQTLAMALHELSTNAVKYGALKQPNGHLTIHWRQEILEETGEAWLHVDWRESGVEVPASIGRTGQGRELIERVRKDDSWRAR